MTQIPTFVVDDSEVDRFLASRRLSKNQRFGTVEEAVDGQSFLQRMYPDDGPAAFKPPPLLVLMDINMPGKNGFETLQEVQQKMRAGQGPHEIVVMMYSSSSDPSDLEQAKDMSVIQGFIVKPIDDGDVANIAEVYAQAVA